MEATIILAEAVTLHPDGTFSMLRGGITRVWGALPVILKAALLVRFMADTTESGQHNWRICVIDEDGKDVMPRLQGSFSVPAGGGAGNVVMGFCGQFAKYGTFSFRLTLDRHLDKSWDIEVREAEKPVDAKE